MKRQDSLRTLSILYGHHQVEWASTIQVTYKGCQQSPTPGHDPKQTSNNTPLEIPVLLLIETMRNSILHEADCFINKIQINDSQMMEKLLTYKQKQTTLLQLPDPNLTDFSQETTIAGWQEDQAIRYPAYGDLSCLCAIFHVTYTKIILSSRRI